MKKVKKGRIGGMGKSEVIIKYTSQTVLFEELNNWPIFGEILTVSLIPLVTYVKSAST